MMIQSVILIEAAISFKNLLGILVVLSFKITYPGILRSRLGVSLPDPGIGQILCMLCEFRGVNMLIEMEGDNFLENLFPSVTLC